MAQDQSVGLTSPAPRVSVVMAVYNDPVYVPLAIDSILGQSFGDFEFIIFDDASTDETSALLDRYAARDARIRLIRNLENLGLPRNLNRGLQLARGAYIARMDSDDISLPDRLASQVAYLDAHPSCLLLGTGIDIIDDDGHFLRRDNGGTSPATMLWTSLFRPPLSHPTAMMRRAVVDIHGLDYDVTLSTAQDFDLWGRILLHGDGANLAETQLLYRMHARNLSSKRHLEQLANSAMIAKRNVRRRWPNLTPEELARVDALFDTMYAQAAPGPTTVGDFLSAMELLLRRSAADTKPTPADLMDMRRSATRWIVRHLVAQHRLWRQPARMAGLTWHMRHFLGVVPAEAMAYARRRRPARVA